VCSTAVSPMRAPRCFGELPLRGLPGHARTSGSRTEVRMTLSWRETDSNLRFRRRGGSDLSLRPSPHLPSFSARRQKFARLSAGGRWIRIISTAENRRHLHGAASRSCCLRWRDIKRPDMTPSRTLVVSRGTDGSNPLSSSGESCEIRYWTPRERHSPEAMCGCRGSGAVRSVAPP
jgi:hypothetical protein